MILAFICLLVHSSDSKGVASQEGYGLGELVFQQEKSSRKKETKEALDLAIDNQ